MHRVNLARGLLSVWLALAASAASAQSPAGRDADSTEDLVVTLVPYGWIQRFTGTVTDTQSGSPSGQVTPFLANGIAAGGRADLRLGATVARFDFSFSQSSPGAVTRASGELAGTFSRAILLDALIGYRVARSEQRSLEIFGGLRIAHVGKITTLETAADLSIGRTESWGNGVVGARYVGPLALGWYLDGRIDAGGEVSDAFGGSRTWAFDVSIGRAFSPRIGVIAGYKGVYEWRDHTPLQFQLGLHGVMAGVQFTSTRPYR